MTHKRLAGHTFLATLGKKRLRPGGVKATNFLMQKGNFTSQTKVLEVACNQGTSAIELVKKYGFKMTAVDLDEKALEIAKENAKKQGVEENINFIQADARQLPFEDNLFDVVINEAMLTMLSDSDKQKALKEYLRVLKPGGKLLTHDVMMRADSTENQEKAKQDISRAIFVHVQPHTQAGWKTIFEQAGYKVDSMLTGAMSLMNPIGMIRDEGFLGTIRLASNGLKKDNRPQFIKMFKTFKRHSKDLGFIAVVSEKK